MKLSSKQINSIAQDLDCGLICFVHKETKEVISVVDPADPFNDQEVWEEYEKVEENPEDYIRIDKMHSSASFDIMADFAEEVRHRRLQSRLFNALNNRKPFRNFKEIVDSHEPTRQAWFKFKTAKFEEYVEECLAMESEDENEYDEEEAPQINGFFNDDGTPFNPNLHPLPSLCLSCKKKDDPNEELLCNLNRMDQVGEAEFKCFAYEQK